jgi:hypothetical protein
LHVYPVFSRQFHVMKLLPAVDPSACRSEVSGNPSTLPGFASRAAGQYRWFTSAGLDVTEASEYVYQPVPYRVDAIVERECDCSMEAAIDAVREFV